MAGRMERQPRKTVRFQIEKNFFRRLFLGNYLIECLLPHIYKFYFKDEDETVRNYFAGVLYRADARDYLVSEIQRLNRISGNRIPRLTGSITIPTVLFFLRAVFPRYEILKSPEQPIRINPDFSMLDMLEHNRELVDIVQNSDRTVELDALSDDARNLIIQALHTLRIYTFLPDDDGNDPLILNALTIFQREMMEMTDECCTGSINSQTLIYLNNALFEGRHREPFFTNINDNARYVIAPRFLSVRDLINVSHRTNMLAFYNDMADAARSNSYSGNYRSKTLTKTRINEETGEEEEYTEIEWINAPARTYCNTFLFDMIFRHFGLEIRNRVFGDRTYAQQANDMFVFFVGNPYMERIAVGNLNDDILKIQALADAGDIVIMAFRNDTGGSGHVAFVGPRRLTVSSVPPRNAAERHSPNQRDNLNALSGFDPGPGTAVPPSHLPILVHAGTYSGVTTVTLGTTGWRNERATLLQDAVRFYRVRME